MEEITRECEFRWSMVRVSEVPVHGLLIPLRYRVSDDIKRFGRLGFGRSGQGRVLFRKTGIEGGKGDGGLTGLRRDTPGHMREEDP